MRARRVRRLGRVTRRAWATDARIWVVFDLTAEPVAWQSRHGRGQGRTKIFSPNRFFSSRDREILIYLCTKASNEVGHHSNSATIAPA